MNSNLKKKLSQDAVETKDKAKSDKFCNTMFEPDKKNVETSSIMTIIFAVSPFKTWEGRSKQDIRSQLHKMAFKELTAS